MIPAYRKLQINLQHRFYIKGLKTNNRVQKHSGRLKTEFEIQYDNHDDNTGELHVLPTDVMPTCPIFTGKTGSLDGPPRRKRLSNSGCADLLEVSGDTTC